MRFRRRVRIAPGVHLNFGKKSVGFRVGGRGYGFSANSRTGSRVTVGIPGSGVSYSRKVGGGSRNIRYGRGGRAPRSENGNLGCFGFLALFFTVSAIGSQSGWVWFLAVVMVWMNRTGFRRHFFLTQPALAGIASECTPSQLRLVAGNRVHRAICVG